MSDLIHTSCTKIVKMAGPVREAFIEDFKEPVMFGVHGKIAAFYGVKPEKEYPATLDCMIGAIGGWLTGTFAKTLEVRGIIVAPGELTAEVAGDIKKVEKTIRISDIRVKYFLAIPKDKREEANRALDVHPAGCPAHESVKDSINISISAEFK